MCGQVCAVILSSTMRLKRRGLSAGSRDLRAAAQALHGMREQLQVLAVLVGGPLLAPGWCEWLKRAVLKCYAMPAQWNPRMMRMMH